MRNIFAAIVAATMMMGTAAAQTPSPTPTAKVPAHTAKAPVVRTAKSVDCSKQADAKGLHGKPRKSFMSGCKKA